MMSNFNVVSQHVFSGTNQQHLEEHKLLWGLDSDQWAGYKQWQSIGRQVTGGKGCGCKIYVVVQKKVKDAETGDAVKKNVLKALVVFNIQHTSES